MRIFNPSESRLDVTVREDDWITRFCPSDSFPLKREKRLVFRSDDVCAEGMKDGRESLPPADHERVDFCVVYPPFFFHDVDVGMYGAFGIKKKNGMSRF